MVYVRPKLGEEPRERVVENPFVAAMTDAVEEVRGACRLVLLLPLHLLPLHLLQLHLLPLRLLPLGLLPLRLLLPLHAEPRVLRCCRAYCPIARVAITALAATALATTPVLSKAPAVENDQRGVCTGG